MSGLSASQRYKASWRTLSLRRGGQVGMEGLPEIGGRRLFSVGWDSIRCVSPQRKFCTRYTVLKTHFPLLSSPLLSSPLLSSSVRYSPLHHRSRAATKAIRDIRDISVFDLLVNQVASDPVCIMQDAIEKLLDGSLLTDAEMQLYNANAPPPLLAVSWPPPLPGDGVFTSSVPTVRPV
jgi:hypothetical protein